MESSYVSSYLLPYIPSALKLLQRALISKCSAFLFTDRRHICPIACVVGAQIRKVGTTVRNGARAKVVSSSHRFIGKRY